MKKINKIKYNIIAILKVIWLILIPLIIVNTALYLLGTFIAMDWNPINWWLFNSAFGRVIIVIIEFLIISNTPNFWEAYEDL